MKRMLLLVGVLALGGCVPAGGAYDVYPTGSPNPYGVHPDPLCFYDEPFEPGGPPSVVCA